MSDGCQVGVRWVSDGRQMGCPLQDEQFVPQDLGLTPQLLLRNEHILYPYVVIWQWIMPIYGHVTPMPYNLGLTPQLLLGGRGRW